MNRNEYRVTAPVLVRDIRSFCQRNEGVVVTGHDYLHVAVRLQDSGEPLGRIQRKNLFRKVLTGDAATIDSTMAWINNDNGRVGDGTHGHQDRKRQENNSLGEKMVRHEQSENRNRAKMPPLVALAAFVSSRYLAVAI
jgi:hypothetical protein